MSGDPSRPFKWVTLVCSVVTVGFLVAAAVSETITADWRGHQAVFRGILEARAKDDAARATGRNFPIEIRPLSRKSSSGPLSRCPCHPRAWRRIGADRVRPPAWQPGRFAGTA